MENYNYFDAVQSDVADYIRSYIELNDWRGDRDGLIEQLNDDLFASNVTGNDSGSYTYNSALAEDYICGNLRLLREASDRPLCPYG